MRLFRLQMIIMLSGLLLIFFGIAAVCFQSYNEIIAQQHAVPIQPNDLFVNSTEFKATTRFAGIELILIGAILEVVGYVGTRPWKDDKNSN